MMKPTHILVAIATIFSIIQAQDAAPIRLSNPVVKTAVSNQFNTPVDNISIPRMMTYQGRLTDPTGNPVPDSTYQLTFRLYPQATGGTPFWTEVQNVNVQSGLFSVFLGAVTPITSLPEDGNAYLSLQVGTEPELSPRLRIVAAGYSFLAEKAQTLDQNGAATGQVLKWNGTAWVPADDQAGGPPSGPAGGDLTGEYPDPSIAADAVTSAKIADGTITRDDVAPEFKAPYADTADYAKDIPDNTVTSEKIADGTITRADVAPDFKAPYADTADYALTTLAIHADTADYALDIADNTVTSDKIADGAVTMSKINHSGANIGQVLKWNGVNWGPADDQAGGPPSGPAGGDLTGEYPDPSIAADAVTSAKIADGTITRDDVAPEFKAPYADTADYAKDIPDNTVTSAKIADNAVTNFKIANNAVTNLKIANNAVTSVKIVDGTIVRADVAPDFKAPYADTADYA
ncbi:MAG: hypothetical protein ACPL0F_08000, partial [bacterium]